MPALVVRELAVRTRNGRVILRVNHLDVAAGEALGICGPSGAGKSTLLHAIAGLIVPATGSIRWDDHDLARLPEAGRSLGRGLREFKDSVSGVSSDDDDDGREPALAAAVANPAGPISEAKTEAAAEPAPDAKP